MRLADLASLLCALFAFSCEEKRASVDIEKEGEEQARQAMSAEQLVKAMDCAAVIDTINASSGVFKDSALVDAQQIDAKVKQIEAFEKKMGELALTAPDLPQLVVEYRQMIRDMAAVMKDLKDPAKLEGLEKRSKAITDKEDELVKKMNAHCGRP